MTPDHVLEELAKTLDLTAVHIEQCQEPSFWVPRASSPFDQDLQNSETDENGVPWGPQEPTHAFELARVNMFAVGDGLNSIRKLLEPRCPVLGTAIMARSTFESAATAFWLTDPQITVRQRVARAYTVFWYESQAHLKFSRAAGSPQVLATAQEHLETVLTRMDDLGFASAGHFTVGGENLPSKAGRTMRLFSGVVQPDDQDINTVYANVTHGEMTRLMTGRLTPPAGDAVWTITPRQLTNDVELALIAFRELHRRLRAGGMGNDPDLEFQLWESNVDRQLAEIKRALR